MNSNLKYQAMAQFFFFFIHLWLMMQQNSYSTSSPGPMLLVHEHGFTTRDRTVLETDKTRRPPNVETGGANYNPQVPGGNRAEGYGIICIGPRYVYNNYYFYGTHAEQKHLAVQQSFYDGHVLRRKHRGIFEW